MMQPDLPPELKADPGTLLDSDGASIMMPQVYEELRRLAHSYFRGQRSNHTLEPTALVNEAYIKLADQDGNKWEDRTHFLAVAATAMRHILINYAHRRNAQKRGGGSNYQRVTLSEAIFPGSGKEIDLCALDDAMKQLANLDERKSKIVEARFFGGLTNDEVAHVLGVSKTTVESDWRMARAWLSREMAVEGV